jgi:phosphatidylinositol-3-phosphatase
LRLRIAAAAAVLTATGALVPAASASTAATAAPLPAITHVWQIQLENESESASFAAPGTELNQLTQQGVFLPDYYATGHVSADNYIAQVSGQIGNPMTDSDCQDYVDFEGTVTSQGYPAGIGCVYPSSVKTLPDLLANAGLNWNGWMEDMGNTPGREPATCGQPGSSALPGTQDGTQAATANDQYAARHNPFVYFHSLVDGSPSPCQTHVLPFSQFQTSLTNPANWNWITPNLCDDGHDSPCKGPDVTGANPGPGGLTSANAFLAKWVPIIEASPEYQNGGMIVITFDEASTSDFSSCCGELPGTTGVQSAAPGFGGGKVGAVLLSPAIHPHTSSCAYNHFSMLRTYEDLFGVSNQGYLGNASVANSLDPELTAISDPCA